MAAQESPVDIMEVDENVCCAVIHMHREGSQLGGNRRRRLLLIGKSFECEWRLSSVTANELTFAFFTTVTLLLMEPFTHPRGRGRGGFDPSGRGRSLSRNKQWVAGESNTNHPRQGGATDGERWERGGARGGRGRGRGAPRGGPTRTFPNATLRNPPPIQLTPVAAPPAITMAAAADGEEDNDDPLPVINEPVLETQEEREKMYQEVPAVSIARPKRTENPLARRGA